MWNQQHLWPWFLVVPAECHYCNLRNLMDECIHLLCAALAPADGHSLMCADRHSLASADSHSLTPADSHALAHAVNLQQWGQLVC